MWACDVYPQSPALRGALYFHAVAILEFSVLSRKPRIFIFHWAQQMVEPGLMAREMKKVFLKSFFFSFSWSTARMHQRNTENMPFKKL